MNDLVQCKGWTFLGAMVCIHYATHNSKRITVKTKLKSDKCAESKGKIKWEMEHFEVSRIIPSMFTGKQNIFFLYSFILFHIIPSKSCGNLHIIKRLSGDYRLLNWFRVGLLLMNHSIDITLHTDYHLCWLILIKQQQVFKLAVKTFNIKRWIQKTHLLRVIWAKDEYLPPEDINQMFVDVSGVLFSVRMAINEMIDAALGVFIVLFEPSLRKQSNKTVIWSPYYWSVAYTATCCDLEVIFWRTWTGESFRAKLSHLKLFTVPTITPAFALLLFLTHGQTWFCNSRLHFFMRSYSTRSDS